MAKKEKPPLSPMPPPLKEINDEGGVREFIFIVVMGIALVAAILFFAR